MALIFRPSSPPPWKIKVQLMKMWKKILMKNSRTMIDMILLQSSSGKVTAFSHLVRRRPRRRSAVPLILPGPPLLMRKKGNSRKAKAPPPLSQNPPRPDRDLDLPTGKASSSLPDPPPPSPLHPPQSPPSPPSPPQTSLKQNVPDISALSDRISKPSDLQHSSSNPSEQYAPVNVVSAADPDPKEAPWLGFFKGSTRRLSKKGTSFTLPSGESCVKIPNSIIQRNQKSWDCFILGQFYSDPPAQGTVHAIANGIRSKMHRDIIVTKMEGNAFLFKIPNATTRNRVLNQGLWQIEGQTMFVAKWQPRVTPQKPELSSAPVWLELRDVPFQFFHEEGFEFIAGQVGEPIRLHQSTKNMTNLEVAKVLTLIDPRKPLPEAVNVQFDSGEISRVLVSSPWMPPVCSFCKEVGHNLKCCKVAPILCTSCKSVCHSTAECPRAKAKKQEKVYRVKKPQASSPSRPESSTLPVTEPKKKGKEIQEPSAITPSQPSTSGQPSTTLHQTTPPPSSEIVPGTVSEWIQVKKKHNSPFVPVPSSSLRQENSLCIDIGLDSLQADPDNPSTPPDKSLPSDSSDVQSSDDGADPDLDEASFLRMFSQRQQRFARGKGSKSH
ncbi:PREDICTED: uncharacterized protein LOC104711727 [Camelina sativa]|uniref:Uncharacterized protein LOC104711727 n=1 Tax=Camelina sativa TaxID=90675 RepID=A0ABM0TI50_CAMSA|nr:PREDICTED: uncharacterized protein LOC104711727 [Camelina sativa]